MKWRIVEHQGRYLVCRKTWHSPEWMGIDKKDIRTVADRGRDCTVEVFADCLHLELARRLLRLKQAQVEPRRGGV